MDNKRHRVACEDDDEYDGEYDPVSKRDRCGQHDIASALEPELEAYIDTMRNVLRRITHGSHVEFEMEVTHKSVYIYINVYGGIVDVRRYRGVLLPDPAPLVTVWTQGNASTVQFLQIPELNAAFPKAATLKIEP
jgi:hypothetical protein